MELLNSSYSHNVRYQIAKSQVESLFMKWISHPASNKLITQLISEIHKPGPSLIAPPSPIFISKIQTQMSPKNQTPPRSPSGEKFLGRTLSPKQSAALLETKISPSVLTGVEIQPSSYGSPTKSGGYMDQFAKTDTEAMANLVKNHPLNKQRVQQQPPQQLLPGAQTSQMMAQSRQPQQDVPKFYFPDGKPPEGDLTLKNDQLIDQIFTETPEIKKEEFDKLTTDVCGFPKFFRNVLFDRIDSAKAGKISKPVFTNFFKRELEKLDIKKRMFKIIGKPGAEFLTNDDFKPLFRMLLETHPGLDFLQATPEFQDRYADTVVMRIFYMVDSNDDGKITLRDFKLSNLKDVFFNVAAEEDINKIREYFSYEHFYVLYCRFWELDTDHDFLIDKEDFSRYEGHALSRKAVDRIFEQVPRKFKSGQKDKMGYEDFVWFMLSEEDKTTFRSLQYWFSIIDLDSNDIITPHEMEYFYEEQVHRLEYLNHEPILFVDLLCQMNDMIKPSKEGHFGFQELRKYNIQVGIFFNCLVNLNKFIAYETRDLFAIKHQQTEFPNYTEWDRFAKAEYERLAMEEENGEDSEMLDAMEGWDSDKDGENAEGGEGKAASQKKDDGQHKVNAA